MSINDIIMSIDNFVWGISLIILSLGSGLLFSIVLKFPQIRLFKEMLKCSFKNNKADSGWIIPNIFSFYIITYLYSYFAYDISDR